MLLRFRNARAGFGALWTVRRQEAVLADRPHRSVSEVNSRAGIEQIEIVQGRVDVREFAMVRHSRIFRHEIDLGREVLEHRVDMHIRRIDGLI